MKSVLGGFIDMGTGAPRETRSAAEQGPLLLGEIPQPVPAGNRYLVPLPLVGQGAVAFEVGNFGAQPPDVYRLRLVDENRAKVAEIRVRDTALTAELFDADGEVRTAVTREVPGGMHLLRFSATSAFLWVSVDRAHNTLRVGHGYMMRRNELLALQEDVPKGTSHGRVWAVSAVHVDDAVRVLSAPKVNRMPVVVDAPPVILDSQSITLENIARNEAISPVVLPEEAQLLHGSVAGRNIGLSAEDAAAINYSLDTPGKTLFEKLNDKRKEFGDPNMVYIRVTIGPNEGDSPGSPFVLELWPKGCRSPVHNHGGTVAVIKVLHGSIRVRWFNPLADDHGGTPVCFDEQVFDKGDVTWITPEMYQTHQLENPRNDTMCATIQSYRYLDRDDQHYEFFDWLPPPGSDKGEKLQHFDPDSDFEYLQLLRIVRQEYAQRSR
jgi:hypothetical protein